MHIVLGATGNIGSVLTQILLDKGEKVLAVTHNPQNELHLREKGCEVAVLDINDEDALRSVFKKGQRAFLLNPPAHPSTDTDLEEKKTVHSILKAVRGSGLHKIVAASTYGAQKIERAGDLGVLYELEQGLEEINIPLTVIRSSYYMSNWASSIESVLKDGIVYSMIPRNQAIPMISPADIAQLAHKLLMEPIDSTGTYHISGPEDYSANDVAIAFAVNLNKPIGVLEIPEKDWISTYISQGFSKKSAESYSRMTSIFVNEEYENPSTTIRGKISLKEYISYMMMQRSKKA